MAPVNVTLPLATYLVGGAFLPRTEDWPRVEGGFADARRTLETSFGVAGVRIQDRVVEGSGAEEW